MATETHFHKELDELKENLLMMATLVIKHHADSKEEGEGRNTS